MTRRFDTGLPRSFSDVLVSNQPREAKKQPKYFNEEAATLIRDINDLKAKVARGMLHKQPLLDTKIARLQFVATQYLEYHRDQIITRSTSRVLLTKQERRLNKMQGKPYTKAELSA